MLREDRRGLEGLPLKLLITSLVIALSAPALYSSVHYLEFSASLNVSLREAEGVREAARSAFVGGLGNLRTVDLSLDDTGQEVSIVLGGGEHDPHSALIMVCYRGEAAATLPLEDPSFRIVTDGPGPIVLEGHLSLRLECIMGEEGQVIMAEVV